MPIKDCPITDCDGSTPKISEKEKAVIEYLEGKKVEVTKLFHAIGCKTCLLDSGWHETKELTEKSWNDIPANTIQGHIESQK